MFFKRIISCVLILAMLCSGLAFAQEITAEAESAVPEVPSEKAQPETLTQAEINKQATGFIDIAPDAPYAADVKKLVDYGIINGYEDGTFKPEGEVTRAEMCKMINLTLGYTDFEGAVGFPDVKVTNWYYTYALAAQKQGYVEGYEDKTFRGSNNITRQEVCAILNRLLKPMNLGIPVTITDPVSNWARPHVELIVQNFIMPLEDNNTFRAQENLKRHELATVLSNLAIGPVKKIEAEVRFFVNGEQYGETQTIAVGEIAVTPENPPVPDSSYIFEGWRKIGTEELVDIHLALVVSDVDYEAVFAKKLHDVTFYSRGSVYETQIVAHGSIVEAPKNPEAKGYDFLGWSLAENGKIIKLASTKIEDNVSLYAVFEKTESEGGGGPGGGAPAETTYSVKFYVNGDLYNKQAVAKKNSPYVPEDPELEGYVFLGWSLEKGGEIIYPDSIRVTAAVTLYAVFEKEAEPEPEVFTVTFYADGKKHDTQFVEYGNTPFSVSNPSKEGYVFKYWSKTDGGSEVKIGYYTVTSNVDFYAVFEEEEEEAVYHTVTFYVDGKVHAENTVLDGNKASAPAVPSKEGYNFKGWSKTDGGSITSVSVTVTENLEFYAVFEKIEPKKFTVTFYAYGKVHDSQIVLENETAVFPKNPEVDEASVFVGWSEENGGEVVDVSSIPITYSKNFYAKFEAKPAQKKFYTITFMSNDKVLSSGAVEEGKEISVPADPKKADHEFLGWSKSQNGSIVTVDSVAKENVTYYAVFKEIKKYTVTFHVNGKVYKTSTVVENESASAPTAPSVEGYNFLGWSKTEGGAKVDVGSVKITSNTSFYALLEEVEPEKVFYTVTFKADGKNYDSQSVEENKYAEIPAEPEKEGYTFKGWSSTNGGNVVNVASVKITANTVFYAVFEKNPVYYEVIFMVDGEEYDVQEILEGESAEVPDDPDVEGYVFMGWSKSEGGTTVLPERTPITSDTTYYAVFEEEEEEIVFYNVMFWFDGDVIQKYEVAEGDTVSAPKTPELEEGVSFLGWALEESSDAEDVIEVSDIVIEDHTDFYAVLIENPNSDEFMEKLSRGYKQLKSIKRTTGLTKEVIKIVTECIGYVLEDANNGQFIDADYVGREYKTLVDNAKKIVNEDMSSSEKSQFANLITKSVDQDVQDFLYEYFDIDTNIN